MYEKVFSTEFNISFFSPKIDQCCLCESYKNTNDPDEGLKSKYKLHIQQKELSRLEKNNDIKAARESQNILVACYDLQAVLQAPCGDISVLYYKRKLNCYNFTVYNTMNKHGMCYSVSYTHLDVYKRQVIWCTWLHFQVWLYCTDKLA